MGAQGAFKNTKEAGFRPGQELKDPAVEGRLREVFRAEAEAAAEQARAA
jgi:hypothetical protein